MELKVAPQGNVRRRQMRLNCTFMELKDNAKTNLKYNYNAA